MPPQNAGQRRRCCLLCCRDHGPCGPRGRRRRLCCSPPPPLAALRRWRPPRRLRLAGQPLGLCLCRYLPSAGRRCVALPQTPPDSQLLAPQGQRPTVSAGCGCERLKLPTMWQVRPRQDLKSGHLCQRCGQRHPLRRGRRCSCCPGFCCGLAHLAQRRQRHWSQPAGPPVAAGSALQQHAMRLPAGPPVGLAPAERPPRPRHWSPWPWCYAHCLP